MADSVLAMPQIPRKRNPKPQTTNTHHKVNIKQTPLLSHLRWIYLTCEYLFTIHDTSPALQATATSSTNRINNKSNQTHIYVLFTHIISLRTRVPQQCYINKNKSVVQARRTELAIYIKTKVTISF